MKATAVVPNWNGLRWLPGCLDALLSQRVPAERIIVVDNGSTDGSLELLARDYPGVERIELGRNTGFAAAVNCGIQAATTDAVALVNTDVLLDADWLGRTLVVLAGDPGLCSVATKMLDMADPARIYDAGDVLRRDGVCEQRGRFERDDGDFDEPGEVFAACAGAGLYRRTALLAVGGFDERFFAYIEDVDLGLRLRLAGWRCAYEPVACRHAGGGSSWQLSEPVAAWVERNTLLLVFKAFPLRWAPLVAYRQAGWAWDALREHRLRSHLGGAKQAFSLAPRICCERRRLHAQARVPIHVAVPSSPIRVPAMRRSRRRAG